MAIDPQRKQNVLLSICQSQDNRIHSKTGLFTHILRAPPNDLRQLKQDIIKLSYSIKSVAIQNGEIGILSRRMPLRLKQKPLPAPDNKDEEKQRYQRDFVVHRTFYSAPLQTVHKSGCKQMQQANNTLKANNMKNGSALMLDNSMRESTDKKLPPPVSDTSSLDTPLRSLKKAAKSLKTLPRRQFNRKDTMYTASNKPQITQQSESAHTPVKASSSVPKSTFINRSTKSYSQLLGEVHNSKILKLEPLHGENRMLEHLKKISNLTKVQITSERKMSRIAYLKNINAVHEEEGL